MAKIPIGVEFNSSGQGKVLSSLSNIEKSTRRIRASTVAIGSFAGGAVMKGFRALGQASRAMITDFGKLVEDAKSGAEISDAYTEAGLAQVDALGKGWQDFKTKIESVIVNALPDLVWGIKVVWAEAKFLAEGVGKSIWNFIKSLPETLVTLGENFKIFWQWLTTNWREIATAMGKTLVDIFIANFETSKNLINAITGLVKGEGWNFKIVNPMENIGKNFANIQGPQFKEYAFLERQAEIWAEAGAKRDASMAKAWDERTKTLATQVRGTEKKPEKEKEKKDLGNSLAGALIKGSADAISAINKNRYNSSLEKLALDEARTHTQLLKQTAGQVPQEVEV
jgi:hypothetical protein